VKNLVAPFVQLFAIQAEGFTGCARLLIFGRDLFARAAFRIIVIMGFLLGVKRGYLWHIFMGSYFGLLTGEDTPVGLKTSPKNFRPEPIGYR
jgi:hypothetical protein